MTRETQLPLLRPVQPRDSVERTALDLCCMVNCELPPIEKRGRYLVCAKHAVGWDKDEGGETRGRMTPYYNSGGIVIYHGDCREVLPQLVQPDTCIVDPVWPNSVFPGVEDPTRLFTEIVKLLTVERLVVHLGCTSDPRFLAAVPACWPFLRTCWLRYARPSYRGRILIGSDVAYAYGIAPPARPGRHLLSGETVASRNGTKIQHTNRGRGSSEDTNYDELPHPAPRRLEHLAWLIKVFADKSVIDPCCGTGTTLRAAKDAGIPAIGIEIEERYCEIAAKRLSQEVLAL